MSPSPGERFGPYDILSLIGEGGMGVVYRARDTRLGREVALKTLPSGSLTDATRLQRFEQEARAASALNHPNVLSVFDVGKEGDTPFLVTELLEGQTLKARLAQGPLPARKVSELGMQVAQGLAAVHQKGIIHRDLKPENLFLTKDGQLKILDFGVARTAQSATPPTGTLPLTQSGAVMGTAGYMAPEQVRGHAADHRSDIFALGAILYEALTGQMAFPGESPVERGYAILNADPPEVDSAQLSTSPSLLRIIFRCLEKDAAQRFQDARDVVFALEALGETTGHVALAPSDGGRTWNAGRLAALGIAAFAVMVVTAIAFNRPREAAPSPTEVSAAREAPTPTSRRVTFRSGSISNARFTADGRGFVFAAALEDSPTQVYAGVFDGSQLREASAPGTVLFDASAKDELGLGTWHEEETKGNGLLFSRGFLAGGAPRTQYDGVVFADFGPGDGLVLTRAQDSQHVIEFPAGKALVRSAQMLGYARLSPDQRHVAYQRHPVPGDDRGVVEIIDTEGNLIAKSAPAWTLKGVAWAPAGNEVWFTAGYDQVSRQIYALSLNGEQRLVYSSPGSLHLMDIDPQGRVLVGSGFTRSRMFGKVAGEEREHSLSWLDGSMPLDITPDGRALLFLEGFGPAGAEVQTWLRRFGGKDETPVLLAVGWGRALSPDQRWALVSPTPPFNTLRLVPTGAGEPVDLPQGNFHAITHARFSSEQSFIVFSAVDEDNQPHLYRQTISLSASAHADEPRQLTATPFVLTTPPSPDGKWVAGVNPEQGAVLVSTDDGEVKPLTGLGRRERPIQWSTDGKTLWVSRRPKPNAKIGVELLRYELKTSKLTSVGWVAPADAVGMQQLKEGVLTPDGKHYVYTVNQSLDELFLVEGLR